MPTYTFYNSKTKKQWDGSTQTHKEIKTRDIISKHAKRVARDGFSANTKKTL